MKASCRVTVNLRRPPCSLARRRSRRGVSRDLMAGGACFRREMRRRKASGRCCSRVSTCAKRSSSSRTRATAASGRKSSAFGSPNRMAFSNSFQVTGADTYGCQRSLGVSELHPTGLDAGDRSAGVRPVTSLSRRSILWLITQDLHCCEPRPFVAATGDPRSASPRSGPRPLQWPTPRAKARAHRVCD